MLKKNLFSVHLGGKSNKRTSPGGTEKQGTPSSTRKKEPKRILPYTVPIASPNTPAGKVGLPTPRLVQVTSLSQPGEKTGESDSRSATHPSRDIVVPRRVQVTTLASDVGKSIPSPQQSIDRSTPTQSSVQSTVKPRRIQPIPVPCDSVAPIPAFVDGVNSSSSATPTKESKPSSKAQTNKSSSAGTKKPRRVTTTLLSESCCEKKSTLTASFTKDSSSKTINASVQNTEKKAPRRVLVTKVVENEPSSQGTPCCEAGKALENQKLENINSREDTKLATGEKSLLSGTCSTNHQSIKGDEDVSVSQRNTVKAVSSENSDTFLKSEAPKGVLPASQIFLTPQCSQDGEELIRVARTALKVINNAEGANVHEIPAVQNTNNIESQMAIGQTAALKVHEQPHATNQPERGVAQGVVKQSLAAQHLIREANQKPQAAQQPKAEQQPIQGKVQQSQASQTLEQEVAQQTQAVHQLSETGPGEANRSISVHQDLGSEKNSTISTTAGSRDKSASRSGNKRPYPLEPEVIILND